MYLFLSQEGQPTTHRRIVARLGRPSGVRDVGKEEVGGAKQVNASEGQKGRRDKSDDDTL